jgi:N-acetylmuramoyl-L-alanine amidase
VKHRRHLTMSVIALLMGLTSASQALAAPPNGKGPNTGPSCPVSGGAQVVLDPGHGGSDSGAVNTNYDLQEKDLTLEIAIQTQAILDHAGYTVALTRTTDINLDNSTRGEIANACGASVFVEIHLNGSTDSTVDYTQTFWGKKRKDLSFSQTMDLAMNGLDIPNAGVGQFANGGLLHATMPSTLVEAVFLTNDSEAQQFKAGTRQGAIAAAIATGVEDWGG